LRLLDNQGRKACRMHDTKRFSAFKRLNRRGFAPVKEDRI